MKTKLYARDVGYDPIGSFNRHDPFEIAFVYPRNDRPYIIKGSSKKIEEHIAKLISLGLKAVIWPIDYRKLSRSFSTSSKKMLHKKTAYLIGLPKEYYGAIQKIYGKDKAMRYGDGVNENHNYLLIIFKKSGRTASGQVIFKTGQVIFKKSFKNQPRCFPKCLEQFIPENEKQKAVSNDVSITH